MPVTVSRSFAFLLISPILYVLSCNPIQNKSDAPPPNILLINIDDLGYADTELYGNSDFDTPHLTRLAARGMTFTNAYAAAANCAPSRAVLMTGQYGPRHGIYTVGSSERGKSSDRKLIPVKNKISLQDSVVTFADELRQGGYSTISIGKWHLGEDPTNHGFEVNIAGNHAGHPKSHFSPYHNPDLEDGPEGENLNDRLTHEAIVKMTDDEKPFFIYLPFYAVHTPLEGKPKLVEKYLAKGFEEKTARYGAMVENMDTNIGRILNALDSLEIRDNTLVVFTSDNGGIAAIHSQYPLHGGKGSYYEGGVRVPLVISWPGHIPAGAVSDLPVSNVDFYPTLLSLAGLSPHKTGLDGIDFSGELMGSEMDRNRPLFWHFPIYLQAYAGKRDDSRDTLFRTRPGTTMRKGPWKIHHYFENDEWELYNLDLDPGERTNVVNEQTKIARELQSKVLEWRLQTDAAIPREINPNFEK